MKNNNKKTIVKWLKVCCACPMVWNSLTAIWETKRKLYSTSVTSLIPKTHEHQCRTQLVSNHRRIKLSFVTMSLFRLDSSSEFESVLTIRVDENTITFWWFVSVDWTVSFTSHRSSTSDETIIFLSSRGTSNHFVCAKRNQKTNKLKKRQESQASRQFIDKVINLQRFLRL